MHWIEFSESTVAAVSLFQNKQNFKLSGKLVLFYRSTNPGDYLLGGSLLSGAEVEESAVALIFRLSQTLLHLCTVFCSCIVLPNQVVYFLQS